MRWARRRVDVVGKVAKFKDAQDRPMREGQRNDLSQKFPVVHLNSF